MTNITNNEMAIGGHYEYLPKADIETLHYILADRENRYESRFRWEAQAELRRREQAAEVDIESDWQAELAANREGHKKLADWYERAFSGREQAQHSPEDEPADDRLRTLLVAIDEALICNPNAAARVRDLINDRLRNPYAADMASGKRGIAEQAQDAELAAENERLRGLLAALVLIAEDATHRSKDQYTPDSYARRCAAIEAAKEIHNAK